MVIDACKRVDELGFDSRRVMFVEATDINRTCFHATYLQLSILGILARVQHGNTLSNEMWQIWATPRLQLHLRQAAPNWSLD